MTIPIACAQLACAPFDRASNLDKADCAIREAARLGARLILLPEFLATGCAYDRRLHDFAEPLGGVTTAWMQRHSRQTGCWVAGGILEEADGRVFSTALLAGPGGELFSYRKQFPAFFEMLFLHRGQAPGIFDTPLGRVGVMICWDMVHGRLSRQMAGRIDLLLICSGWPALRGGNIPLYGMRGWLDRQPAHRPRRLAEGLGVPVVYCNLTGDFVTRVPYLGLTFRSQFAGASSITNAAGRTVAAAGREEKLLLADISGGKSGPRREAA
jgi:N-carbamoylputrescine amidase